MSLLSKRSQTQNYVKDNYWPISSANICYNGYKRTQSTPSESHGAQAIWISWEMNRQTN